MRVGADACIRIRNGLAVHVAGPDGLTEIFEIHLVTNSGARRHDAEILKRGRAPAQEFIALLVALILDLDILLETVRTSEIVDHDRVIDDQIDGDLRVDRIGAGAQILRRIAHRSEVDHRWHASKVLHQDAGGPVSDLVSDLAAIVEPGLERDDIVLCHRRAVFIAQHVFEQHFQGGREF